MMTRRFPDLGSSSDWLKQISHMAQPIRNTSQFWVVARLQYGVFALFSQTLGLGETSGGVKKCCFVRLCISPNAIMSPGLYLTSQGPSIELLPMIIISGRPPTPVILIKDNNHT